jgi:hypothetical protein
MTVNLPRKVKKNLTVTKTTLPKLLLLASNDKAVSPNKGNEEVDL